MNATKAHQGWVMRTGLSTLSLVASTAYATTLTLPTGVTLEISDATFTEHIGNIYCGATATGFDDAPQ